MAQHYYDLGGTHFLEQHKMNVETAHFSDLHIEFLTKLIRGANLPDNLDPKLLEGDLKILRAGLKKYFTIKNQNLHSLELLTRVASMTAEQKKAFRPYVDHIVILNEKNEQFLQSAYSLYGSAHKIVGEMPGLKYLKKEPVSKLSDKSKSTKIQWADQPKQKEFLLFVPKILATLEEVIKDPKISQLSEQLVLRKMNYIAGTTIDELNVEVPLSRLVKKFRVFWNSVEKNIVPLMEQTYAFKEKDYIYKEFTGSLDNPDELLADKQVHYMMGHHKGAEGFIGLDYSSGYGYNQGGYNFKLFKELKNAHVFTRDMSAELSSFKPLTKINFNMSLTGIESGLTPQTQKISAFIEKRALEANIAASTEAKPQVEFSPKIKRHKI